MLEQRKNVRMMKKEKGRPKKVKRKKRKGLRKVDRVIKWRGVPRLRASRSRLACRSKRVATQQRVRWTELTKLHAPNHYI